MTTESHMINRAIKSIDVQINQSVENINTWSMLLIKSIKMKRRLIGDKKLADKLLTLDKKLLAVANKFVAIHYTRNTNSISVDVDTDSDTDSDVASDTDTDADDISDKTKVKDAKPKASDNYVSYSEDDIDEKAHKSLC